ncbi:MAG: cytochrome c biogenesis protein ResB, partial [Tepidiformaceae bacterium]
VVYDDVVDFDSQSVAVPVMKVTDSKGNVLFNQDLPQMGTDTGGTTFDPGSSAAGTTVALAGANAPADDRTLSAQELSSGTLIGTATRPVATALLNFPKAPGTATDIATEGLSWRVDAGQLLVSIQSATLTPRFLQPGDTVQDGDYRIEYSAATSIPAIKVNNVPGSISDDGSATFQMPIDASSNPYLYVTGIDLANVALTQGNTISPQNGFHYAFEGQVNAGGISVKRDPGSTFIWLAVGMAIIGLGITFYVPRRRLWVKVSEGRTFMAGVAERTTRFSLELRKLGAELGSNDALQPGDLEREH